MYSSTHTCSTGTTYQNTTSSTMCEQPASLITWYGHIIIHYLYLLYFYISFQKHSMTSNGCAAGVVSPQLHKRRANTWLIWSRNSCLVFGIIGSHGIGRPLKDQNSKTQPCHGMKQNHAWTAKDPWACRTIMQDNVSPLPIPYYCSFL